MTGATEGATEHVEREARQLVEAATRWLSAVPDNDEYAARTVDLEADAEASAGSGAAGLSDDGPRRDTGREHAQHADDSAQEHVCRGCPWCRAKAAAGPIGADTLDSLAHLLSTAAESLSLFAQSRREASQESARGDDTTSPPDAAAPDFDAATAAPDLDAAAAAPDTGAAVDDAVIDWDDEDEDELRAGEGEQSTQSPTKEKQPPSGTRRDR